MIWKNLWKDLDKIRSERNVSWRTIGLETGIHSSLFTRLSKGRGISGGNLNKLARFMGQFPWEGAVAKRKAR